MKKMFVVAALALTGFGASAQNKPEIKIGYINTDELIAIMPEYQTAMKEMQDLQESLDKQGQELNDEAEQKRDQFLKDSATYTPTMKEIKREELIKLIQRVQNYSNEAQEKIKQTGQQKMTPIQQKAVETIRTVSKEKGYTYILDNNAVLVGPPGDDILPIVKAKLGIKEVVPAAPIRKP
jgi:outer membrane protein